MNESNLRYGAQSTILPFQQITHFVKDVKYTNNYVMEGISFLLFVSFLVFALPMSPFPGCNVRAVGEISIIRSHYK